MQTQFTTPRLILNELGQNYAAFMLKLLNTPGWLKFIGDRNIKAIGDAEKYIQQITNNHNIQYWVVSLKDDNIPIGVITFIKRNYLDYPDIGFAFLPEYTTKGYAFETAKSVLNAAMQSGLHPRILATTLKDNEASIKLLARMGFRFEKEIEVENERLQLYVIDAP